MSDTSSRKKGHLDLFRGTQPAHGSKTTLMEEVQLVPDPLPQLALSEVDPAIELFGRSLAFPLIISGMTGGTQVAAGLNRALAQIAGEMGLGIGVGSQRAMLENRGRADTYTVRDAAGADTLVLGNLGIAQVPGIAADDAQWLVDAIDADALVVHLNVAQELVQSEGDRDFRGTAEALERLCSAVDKPVIVKEVGSGIPFEWGERFRDMGVAGIDVAGAGGTSWTYAEALRGDSRSQRIGMTFRDWGIPTAAAVAELAECGLPVVASGGIRTGLDIAKSIALGASACGIASPVIRTLMKDGADAARRLLAMILEEFRVAQMLTGSATVAELGETRRVLGPTLRAWMESAGR